MSKLKAHNNKTTPQPPSTDTALPLERPSRRTVFPDLAMPIFSTRCSRCQSTDGVTYHNKTKRFYCPKHHPGEKTMRLGICQNCGKNPACHYPMEKQGGKIKVCITCNAKNKSRECFICNKTFSATNIRKIMVGEKKKYACAQCLAADPGFFNGECISCHQPAFLIYKSQKGKGTKADLCRPCYDGNDGRREKCQSCQRRKKVGQRDEAGRPFCSNCRPKSQ